jgi:hypothetical protein
LKSSPFVALVFLAACTHDGSLPVDSGPEPDSGPRVWGDIGPTGGQLDTLSFAIVGDTRPATIDDTAGYPTAIIRQIWQAVQDENPRPAFGISTGDYMFAKQTGTEVVPQMKLYTDAHDLYSNIHFPAMGNHECTGATASNCGNQLPDGVTQNYDVFMRELLGPLGITKPYYTVNISAKDGSWTAKFVFVAGNSWAPEQGTWLEAELSKPTTYTFVVRHENSTATEAPGVTPSAQVIARHPLTMLIVGHTHTFAYYQSSHEVVVGNGGAPATGSVPFGYVVARQRADGAIVFTAIAAATHTTIRTFAVRADGSAAP